MAAPEWLNFDNIKTVFQVGILPLLGFWYREWRIDKEKREKVEEEKRKLEATEKTDAEKSLAEYKIAIQKQFEVSFAKYQTELDGKLSLLLADKKESLKALQDQITAGDLVSKEQVTRGHMDKELGAASEHTRDKLAIITQDIIEINANLTRLADKGERTWDKLDGLPDIVKELKEQITKIIEDKQRNIEGNDK